MRDVALIILNYNSADDTLDCAKRLLLFEKNFHIIVVDNASTDDSYKTIIKALGQEQNIDVIRAETNRGYSAGNNLGMKYAIEKYGVSIVGVLNPDVRISRADVLIRMYNVLHADPQYAVAGASVINEKSIYNPGRSGWNIPAGRKFLSEYCLLNGRIQKAQNFKMIGEGIAEVDCVAGCFFLAKADVMQKLGYLDENVFLYYEENLLGMKCKEIGYKEVIVMDQFYIHDHHNKKENNITFARKVTATKNSYTSAKYFCEKYYGKHLLPFLGLVECFNRMYLAACYIKNKMIHR